MEEKQLRLLQCLADVLKDNGYHSELLKAPDQENPTLLRVESRRMGKVGQDISIEMCYVPIQLPNEGEALVQFYLTLFHGLPEHTAAQTQKACLYCNEYCALGSFGYFKAAGQVYLKHNMIVNLNAEFKDIVTITVDSLSLLLASVNRFIDAFAAIGNGVMDVKVAIEQELLPRI